MVIESIRQYFSGLPDPRCRRGRRHKLSELVIIAILGVICCTDDWQEVAQFARAKRKWLKSFLELPHGIPSHDTFGRVFAAISPEAFERCFLAWIAALAKVRPGELIAIDGKTLRRSFNLIQWQGGHSHDQCLVLGQRLGVRAIGHGGQEQRDHRHPEAAGVVGHPGGGSEHRCDGLPEGNCPQNR